MANFDFHSNLSPQFERTIRDMLVGIDIKSVDTREKIICQTKLFQNRYSQLIKNPKKEVSKIKRHKPNRFPVAISCSLIPNNTAEILSLFTNISIGISPLSKAAYADQVV